MTQLIHNLPYLICLAGITCVFLYGVIWPERVRKRLRDKQPHAVWRAAFDLPGYVVVVWLISVGGAVMGCKVIWDVISEIFKL